MLAKKDRVFQGLLHPGTHQAYHWDPDRQRSSWSMVLDRELYDGATWSMYPTVNGASRLMSESRCAVGKESIGQNERVRVLSFRIPETKWTGLVREAVCAQHYKEKTGVPLK